MKNMNKLFIMVLFLVIGNSFSSSSDSLFILRTHSIDYLFEKVKIDTAVLLKTAKWCFESPLEDFTQDTVTVKNVFIYMLTLELLILMVWYSLVCCLDFSRKKTETMALAALAALVVSVVLVDSAASAASVDSAASATLMASVTSAMFVASVIFVASVTLATLIALIIVAIAVIMQSWQVFFVLLVVAGVIFGITWLVANYFKKRAENKLLAQKELEEKE